MRSIKVNYIYNLIYQLITIVTPMVLTPYLSRVFGAYYIGVNSYTNSVVTYFLLFAALGTAFYGKREASIYRDDREGLTQVFWEIELLSVVSTLICLVIWLVFVFFQDRIFFSYFIVLSIQIIAIAFDISWLFAGVERFDKIVSVSTAVKLCSLILVFLCVKEKTDLWKYLLINSCGVLGGNISLWIFLREMVDSPRIQIKNMKYHFSQTLIFFLPTIATTIYTVLDKTMLQVITKDFNENGFYEQAVKLCRIPMTLILSMDAVVASRTTYFAEKKAIEKIKDRLVISLDFVAFLGVGMVLGIDAIVDKLVPWFFGPGYENVVGLVRFYSPLIICIAINNFLSEQYLTPVGKRKQTAIVVSISALLNLLLNLFFIPVLGAKGASLTSVFSEAFIAIVYIVMCLEVLPIKTYFRCFWKKILAGVIMFFSIRVVFNGFDSSIMLSICQILCGVSVYTVFLIALKDGFTISIFDEVKKKITRKE